MINKTEKRHSKRSPQQHKKKTEEESKGIRGIVRLAGRDIAGNVKFKKALIYVRGIGYTLANSVAMLVNKELGIAPGTMIGELSDEQIEKVDKILFNLSQYKIPPYLLNRRSDVLEGVNRHLIMNDLLFVTSQDIEREKKSYSWRGYRHAYGQKVRGQRTRNTGRSGMAVGVLRKSVLQQQQKEAGASGGSGGKAKKARSS